jgi:hypothetical protein
MVRRRFQQYLVAKGKVNRPCAIFFGRIRRKPLKRPDSVEKNRVKIVFQTSSRRVPAASQPRADATPKMACVLKNLCRQQDHHVI